MAVVIPAGIIVASQDTLPYGAGWSRVTELDGRFPRGAAVAGGTGGADEHNHTSPHTHVASGSHTHGTGLREVTPPGVTHHWIEPLADYAPAILHGHMTLVGASIGSTTSVLASSDLDLADDDHLPLWRNWTWLKSNGAATMSADEVMFWTDLAARLPFGWTILMENERYLRGTPAAGAVGAEGGSSQSVGHTHAEAAHVHGWIAHTHTASGSGVAGWWGASTPIVTRGTGETVMAISHEHTYSITGCIAAMEDNTLGTTCGIETAVAGDPRCLCVHLAEGSAAGRIAPGLLALWDGIADDIPVGWLACDGSEGLPDYRGLLLKGATDANVGTIEGTLNPTHTHVITTPLHTHATGGNHEHDLTGTCGTGGPTMTCLSGPSGPSRMDYHTHPLYLRGSKTASLGNATPSLSTSSTMPSYYDAILIRYVGQPISTCLLRPRPADLWRVGIDDAGGLALDDIHADGVTDNYSPDLSALSATPDVWDLSAAWFTGTILVALIERPTPGPIRTGFLTREKWIPAGDIPVIGDGFEFVELDVMPAGAMAVGLGLRNEAGIYRWYQACGLWDAVAGEFDWTAVPIECETDAVDFPDADYAKGSLRRCDDASLLFGFQDVAGDSRLFRCAVMPSNATGSWAEV